MASNPVSLREPLRIATFRTIWIAQFASFMGVWLQTVGAQWYLTSAGAAASTIALVQTATTSPTMLIGMPAGVVADLVDRRKVLLAVQFTVAAIGLGLAALTWKDHLTPPLLLAAVFVMGVGMSLADPMWQAVLPEVVPRGLLTSTAMLASVSFNSSRIIGPALGGALVALGGPETAFTLSGLLYLFVGVAVVARFPRSGAAAKGERVRTAIATGLRYIAFSPVMRRVLLRIVLWGSGSSIMYALMPVIARDNLDLSSRQFGLLLGCAGAGAILGVGVLARMRRSLSSDAIVGLSSSLFAITLLVTGLSTNLYLTMASTLLAGTCWMSSLSTFGAIVHLTLPNWVRGRGVASFLVVLQATQALGSLLWGLISDAVGVRDAHAAAAGIMVISVVTLIPLGLHPMAEVDPTSAGPHEDMVDESLSSQPGPVLVAITYTVCCDDVTEFRRRMRLLRLSRIRDGARRWRLYRDPASPKQWSEAFEFPTGREYVLYFNRRQSVNDRQIHQSVEALVGAPTHRLTLLDTPLRPVPNDAEGSATDSSEANG